MNARRTYAASCAAVVLVACSHGDPGHPGNRAADSVQADVPTASIGRRLRRLSHREYDDAVRDLLGDTTAPAERFGPEVYASGFDNGDQGLVVQASDVDAYQQAAEALAATAVATRLPSLLAECDPSAGDAACADTFISGFATSAYRRPPTATELDRLRLVYATGAAMSGLSGGVELVIEAVLQSPAFLYREELGAADPALAPGLVRLTDGEAATELSFLVTGTLPDDALLAAVAAGKLHSGDERVREARRLLATPAGRQAMRSFLHEWLGTGERSMGSKDPSVYPMWDVALGQSMSHELDLFFDGAPTLRALFTSTDGYVDARLAAIYGVRAPARGSANVTLDVGARRGVMTRAGFLAAHADADSSGPVARGVFILSSIVCRPPGPPPPNVPPIPPVSASGAMTTRQRFDQHVRDPVCASCHAAIDGVGFGFEEFDGIGAFRAEENGLPVDSSGALHGTDVDGVFYGASDLGARLADSDEVLRCYLAHAYRYAMGTVEQGDAASRLLARMHDGFGADAPLVAALLTIVGDDAFVVRTTKVGTP